MIYIPSYKRAKDCDTPKNFSKGIICCHDFEKAEYKKYNNNKILAIPDELQGKGMGVIRNFILDNAGEEILMLDDDIKYFGYYEEDELFKMSEEYFYNKVEEFFKRTREAETVLWGLNLQKDRRLYREFAPFSLSSVVLGPCMGIIKDKEIRFDESLGLKEDYDYSVQVARKYRKILRFNKYHYSCGHIKTKGGCAAYRTSNAEEEQAELFKKKWGSKIIRIERKTTGGNNSINPIVHIPIKGI